MLRCFTSTQCQSVSTFESEVRNSLSIPEPCSTDSLGHQHHTEKLSPKIALHFKVLCESKAMQPIGFLQKISKNYILIFPLKITHCAISIWSKLSLTNKERLTQCLKNTCPKTPCIKPLLLALDCITCELRVAHSELKI